jgi:RimJ/RimL family protein N-acetyltransferase
MIVLPDRELHRIRHLFNAEHLALVTEAVIAGNSVGQVWTDDLETPRTALMWDRAHNVYLAGPVDQTEVWRELFGREIAPLGRGIFKLHADAAAEAAFAGYELHRRERVFYRGGRAGNPSSSGRMPAGFQISAINDRFDQLAALANFSSVTEEIGSCWKSVADFLRTGFGFCAHNAETIVCWCTAEYVSDGRCGIGIETIPAYGGRGFATLTASAFAEHCAKRGVIPHWDAWAGNVPSVAVAEKVGFQHVETYRVYVGSFGQVQSQPPP